ncbi:MAG: Unknown protein [uncultured Campylobacterales bacterium]|uniref:Uncharacterized protein n=1 Tax=uncultured Campylobacterales bacterium TaxID=352960 RepID=A0A6S6S4V7_9BACT|nr:MAG: Unknown protein [uncultured Campylobacterales bacterium]
MAYKLDEDLEFLQYCSNDELDVLVETLTKDKNGKKRVTENLTKKNGYIQHNPNHLMYLNEICEEVQRFGGNSFTNIFWRRGSGVQYREVLLDVCNKMKVNYNKKSETKNIEQNLLMKLLEDAMKNMSEKELKEISQELNLKTTNFTSNGVTIALQIAIKQSGFLAYKVALIVANSIARALLGHGLKFGTNIFITRSISIFAGPIGWVITGLWTALDIAGPAYRVTIPVTIQIAYLRQKYINKEFLE